MTDTMAPLSSPVPTHRRGPPEDGLREEVVSLRDAVTVEANDPRLDGVDPAFRASAQNLLAYLRLRRDDLRLLQRRLASRGLSSLGRAEAHVTATLDAVLGALDGVPGSAARFAEAERQLATHTAALFGPPASGRDTRIMVTLPIEAANHPGLIRRLLEAGMDVARINCAHDSREAWEQMAVHVRAAERAVGRPCRIQMDLAGPKLRTGPLAPGPQVLKIRPRRDVYGRVEVPARVWMTPSLRSPPDGADAVLPASDLAGLHEGDRLRFIDARGRRRVLTVGAGDEDGRWAELDRTAYALPGMVLEGAKHAVQVGEVPAVEASLRLSVGDTLVLTRDAAPGRSAVLDAEGRVVEPARVSCSIPSVLDDIRPGEPIEFDDGTIGGTIESVGAEGAVVRITRARPGGRKLRGEKGINLPESTIQIDALTEKDREDLAFVARYADIVGLSFANGPRDVVALQDALEVCSGPDRRPTLLVKIETRRGFEALPEILLAAMRAPACGVMIARGDLAVECGFGRMAEVQEEILWVCEAAHVPVVWATQVLETLAKTGRPSRAEVTDAAMGHRAECVMLNKGPHVLDAVVALDDIFRRMDAHQTKKRPELRALSLAR